MHKAKCETDLELSPLGRGDYFQIIAYDKYRNFFGAETRDELQNPMKRMEFPWLGFVIARSAIPGLIRDLQKAYGRKNG